LNPSATTVLVLAGGDSPERDVSLESARGIAQALQTAGYAVLVADPARPEITPTADFDSIFARSRIAETPPEVDDYIARRAEFTRVLTAHQSYGIDVVFNGLHGGAGEDGTIQAVLDYIGVPYTGSGAGASSLAMDKQRSKFVAHACGVPVIDGVMLSASALGSGTLEQTIRESVGLPCVVKPNAGGSSVGLSVVRDFADLDEAARQAFRVGPDVLVERYIDGREITQAIVGGVSDIPVLEIRPKSGLYDYYHKYQSGQSEYLVPAPLDPAIAAAVRQSAQHTFDALGLSDYARIDFRLDGNGQHYLLEANTLPGFTATSLVPKACKHIGIDYADLCDRIVKLALAE